jgi:pyruvate dehydrogenase E1 component alpha subunit
MKTYRHRGHHVNDPGAYMPQDVLENWKQRDPLLVLKDHLITAGAVDMEVQEIEAEVEEMINEAVQFALKSPEPDPKEFLAEISSL